MPAANSGASAGSLGSAAAVRARVFRPTPQVLIQHRGTLLEDMTPMGSFTAHETEVWDGRADSRSSSRPKALLMADPRAASPASRPQTFPWLVLSLPLSHLPYVYAFTYRSVSTHARAHTHTPTVEVSRVSSPCVVRASAETVAVAPRSHLPPSKHTLRLWRPLWRTLKQTAGPVAPPSEDPCARARLPQPHARTTACHVFRSV